MIQHCCIVGVTAGCGAAMLYVPQLLHGNGLGKQQQVAHVHGHLLSTWETCKRLLFLVFWRVNQWTDGKLIF